MVTFLKAQASAIGATLADFAATFLAVEIANIPKAEARIVGLLVGGVLNFLINRKWVFEKQNKVGIRLLKYMAVWIGNFLLNYAGYWWMLQEFPHIYFVISMVVVAVAVGVIYNYNMQKKFVFK